MKISTVIILAGGLGTRLRSKVPDLPKCMAPVAGRPFISHLIDECIEQGIDHFIFSLGYMHELVVEHVHRTYPSLHARFVIEEEPLGTGGAIQRACLLVPTETVFIINGDTFFNIDMQQAEQFHAEKKADCTLVLKPMKNISRYGVVETGRDHEITGFREKQFYSEGTINGGVYILNVPTFLGLGLPEKFSFEKDFLEKYIQRLRLFGFWQDSYFIDIGIPEDFERANLELLTLRKGNAALPAIGKDWTLFLDRDGVINEEVVGDYIRNWDEFHFRPGSLEAIALLTPLFQRTVIVTNQAGVGKGLMTMEELNHINQLMLRDIHSAGGHIDQVYFCTATDNKDINRKPNPGMALQAKAAFPEIDLSKSIMVGNMPNDMKFGRNFGAYTVYLPTRAEETPDPLTVDAQYKDLLSFAKDLSSNA